MLYSTVMHIVKEILRENRGILKSLQGLCKKNFFT